MVISDRGASFCSKFFSTLMSLLNVKHRISAARAPRSNGLAESLVKRLSDLIKIYVKTDSEIEDYLPLIEMILRSTTHSKLKISPHEVHIRFYWRLYFNLFMKHQRRINNGTTQIMNCIKVSTCLSAYFYLFPFQPDALKGRRVVQAVA